MSRVLAALVLLVPGSAGIASPHEQEDPVMKALDAEVALDHDWIASQPQADTALRASATSLKMMACTLAYYENSTSGGGQIGTDCFAQQTEEEIVGRRMQLSTKLALPPNYAWGYPIAAEVLEHPEIFDNWGRKIQSRPVALRLAPQNGPRLAMGPRVVSLSDEGLLPPDPARTTDAADVNITEPSTPEVWPKKLRVLALAPRLRDGNFTGLGAEQHDRGEDRVSAIEEELYGDGRELGGSSVHHTLATASFNQLRISKTESLVVHLEMLDRSYEDLTAGCTGPNCCEENGDTLKKAMLAALPYTGRWHDRTRDNSPAGILKSFDLLIFYLRGDLLGCPNGRDGYSYFGTATPNRERSGFNVKRDNPAWRLGVTMYGTRSGKTLAHAIGHSLGLHHAGGEGPKQAPKPTDYGFTERVDEAGLRIYPQFGDHHSLMGSVQWLKSTPGLGFSAEHPAPHADVLTSPYASYLGFLPEERVIDAASVDGEVHAVAELQAYELGPDAAVGDGMALRIPCPSGCHPKVSEFRDLFDSYPREQRFLWVSYLVHPDQDKELSHKVHIHFSVNSGGNSGVFTERWRYLAVDESYVPRPDLAVYVCELQANRAKVSVGTSVSNAKASCGEESQVKRDVRKELADATADELNSECTNKNECGQCLRALESTECPGDLASALGDSNGYTRLCGRGSRKGHLCAGHGRCGASKSLHNCEWAKGIYEVQECTDSAPGSLTITVRNGTDFINDCAQLAHLCNSSVDWIDDFRADCPVTCGLCDAPSALMLNTRRTPECLEQATGTKVDLCHHAGKPSDGVQCREYWMQRDKTWSFCQPHATEDKCWPSPTMLERC